MWDTTQQARAHSEGWRLVTTINNGDSHPLWDVAAHGPKFKDDQAAMLGVINAAKQGGTIHQQALKLVMNSRARATQGKK